MTRSFAINLDCALHPIRLGSDVYRRLPDFLPPSTAAVALLGDRTVIDLYGERLRSALRAYPTVHTFTFAPGERRKNRRTKSALEDRLLAAGLGRDGAIVALGGGVTTDLAGFIAGTYQRGLPWLAAPTSLLGMVDAAIGGKTGVNTPAGKNLIGLFHPPRAVLIDPGVLQTLPKIELRNGLAEMIKHAVIADAAYLESLTRDGARLSAGDRPALEAAIARSAQIKGDIAARDSTETNLRQVLNLGHTIGHALERASDHALPHGIAVAVGLSVETRLAVRLGLMKEEERELVRRALRAAGLPEAAPRPLAPERILAATAGDKKSRRGRVHYALPAGLGHMARDASGNFGMEVDARLVLEVLREAQEEQS